MTEPNVLREAALSRAFVMLADTLVADFDVPDLFDHLTAACVELLGATSAGLMVVDARGVLQLVASSSTAIRELELLAMVQDDGPSVECYESGESVFAVVGDPGSRARWPVFVEAATELGMAVVQALPMRLRGETIGALNLFHDRVESVSDRDTVLAQALADLATIALLQRRALGDSELLSAQLQQALTDRLVIEQAKGLLAERGSLAVEEAFVLLRSYVRSNRLLLTATAQGLVSGELDADDVLASRWPSTLQT